MVLTASADVQFQRFVRSSGVRKSALQIEMASVDLTVVSAACHGS